MTPEERERLIQRFYDGEVGGDEAAWAQRLLSEDPEAKALMDSLQEISDSIKIEIAGAVAEEDFSSFWHGIEGRLPEMAPLHEAPPLRVAMQTVDEPNGFVPNQDERVGEALRGSFEADTPEKETSEPVGLRELPGPKPWWNALVGPLAGAAVAAAVTAAILLPRSEPSPEPTSARPMLAVQAPAAPAPPPDHSLEIESVETEGPLVLVLGEGADQPTIVWFVETSGTSEG